jgi:hypothetical protein
MSFGCPRCGRALDFLGEPPRFCGYCGQPLPFPEPEATAAYLHEAATTPPNGSPEAAAAAPTRGAGEDGFVIEAVGRYWLLRPLGGGGMGTVYEAEDSFSGQRVALKLLLPDFAESEEAVERFRQEGRLASTITHPRCVFVIAADEDAGRPYIAMELMPGPNLEELVEERGPLPAEEALARTLDVLDGVHAAHQLGIVHRDVKPSNCFLDTDGRVKVGDFGLAKSLLRDPRLTRPGTLVGTPLYASPEQVKGETIGVESDVYSVAATLYFLLTGRAPFQTSDDALATLARIVSDDPAPMRTLRPELPAALDRVVLRGLERDRKHRWRNLDEFRTALLPFLPVRPSLGYVSLRAVAYLIDLGTFFALSVLLGTFRLDSGLGPLAFAGAYLLYFGLSEGLWGQTVGKRLLRLRVWGVTTRRPPGVMRAVLRAVVFVTLLCMGWVMLGSTLAQWPAWILLCITMRKRNGYRGLHEFLSGTRVVRLPRSPVQRQRRFQPHEFAVEAAHPDGLPERVASFVVRGALRWSAEEKVLLAEDPSLGRKVWIWLWPAVKPHDPKRRDISRATRIRWLACGEHGEWQWDAFLAPSGCPLPDLVEAGGRLSWSHFRPILQGLADELAASCAEGTLPHSLTVDQVWVGAQGAQLLDRPLRTHMEPMSGAAAEDMTTSGRRRADEARALSLLRQVTRAALEGRPRPAEARGTPVHVAVPDHARRKILNPLFGVQEHAGLLERIFFSELLGLSPELEAEQPYETIDELRAQLRATRDRPTEVTRAHRAIHLAPYLPFMGVMLLSCLQALEDDSQGRAGEDMFAAATIVISLTFWVVWAFLFRGGLSFYRGWVRLRRSDGRKPSRLQCAARAFLVWAPLSALLGGALFLGRHYPGLPVLYAGAWWAAVALLVGSAELAIWGPSRWLHDRLVGLHLVPE